MTGVADLHDPAALARIAGKSSFAAGMRVLPPRERAAMYAIYGFCRLVDDIADADGPEWAGVTREERAAALDGWRRDLAALYRGEDPGQAGFLAEAVAGFDLAESDFLAVIDGMQMDLDGPILFPTYARLDLYCDRVASAVGRLSVRVFGMERGQGIALSHHLGRALQLTNILRDIDEDAAIDRVYMPAEALAAAGIRATTPAAFVADCGVDAAAHWLAHHAQHHFAEARAILAAKPAGRLVAPRLMADGYARVLATMLKRGWKAPRRRVSVGKLRLLVSLVRHSLFPG